MISPLSQNPLTSLNTLASNPSASTSGFSLDSFEAELSSLVNQALAAVGVSPSQVSFMFNHAATTPADDSATPAPALTGTILSTTSSSPSQNVDATENGQATGGLGGVRAGIDVGTSSSPAIWDPYNGTFYNTANSSGDRMMTTNGSDNQVNYDAVVRGYEQVFGATSYGQIANALEGRWGQPFMTQYVADHPGDYSMTAAGQQTLTDFQRYGAYGSFTGTDGKSHYFEAQEIGRASCRERV